MNQIILGRLNCILQKTTGKNQDQNRRKGKESKIINTNKRRQVRWYHNTLFWRQEFKFFGDEAYTKNGGYTFVKSVETMVIKIQ